MAPETLFVRETETIEPKLRIVVSTEGSITEPEYFTQLGKMTENVTVEIVNHRDSAPIHVLGAMKSWLKENEIETSDDFIENRIVAWLVTDKNNWPCSQLQKLQDWSDEHEFHNFALSNPKFEFWLVLHFVDGSNIKSVATLNSAIKKFMPGYRKKINEGYFSEKNVKLAIKHAQALDSTSTDSWPKKKWMTTVYKLAKAILYGDKSHGSQIGRGKV